jgi:hypothetical protein
MDGNGYYPTDEKKLRLGEVLYRMRDLRTVICCFVAVWLVWGIMFLSDILVLKSSGAHSDSDLSSMMIITWLLVFFFVLNWAMLFFILWRLRRKDESARLAANMMKFIPSADESCAAAVQNDLYGGLKYLKRRSIAVSDNYVLVSLKPNTLDPMAIPKDMIKAAGYQTERLRSDPLLKTKEERVTVILFVLTNGAEIYAYLNEKYEHSTALAALDEAGIAAEDIARVKAGNDIEKLFLMADSSVSAGGSGNTPYDIIKKQRAEREMYLEFVVTELSDKDRKKVIELLDRGKRTDAVMYFRQHSPAEAYDIVEIISNREKYLG